MPASTPLSSPASSKVQAYERLRPLIIWLGIGELAWIAWWLFAHGSSAPTFHAGVAAWLVVMLGWMALVTGLAGRGFFLRGSWWLSNLVGFTLVVAISTIMFGVVSAVRDGVLAAAAGTSDTQLISIHLLRVLAIGGAVKYWQGALPRHFFLLGPVPDFLFALSAVPMLLLAGGGTLSPTALLIWHGIGAAVFLGAGISMFFSVPSPFRLFHTKPDSSLVFEFPMALAPNFTVPLFVVAHLFAIAKYAIAT